MAYQNQICMNKNTSRRKRINTTTIVLLHPIAHYLFKKFFYFYDCLFIFIFYIIYLSFYRVTELQMWFGLFFYIWIFLYLELH